MTNTPPNFNLNRYSNIIPTSNGWASNLNDRWEIIDALNRGEMDEAILCLTKFYEQTPEYVAPISEKDKNISSLYDYSSWARCVSPLIVEDANYFSHALSSIINNAAYRQGTNVPLIGYTPISKVAPELKDLHCYVKVDLDAPDEVIMHSIKQYLSYARGELNMTGVPLRFKGVDFNSWQQHLLIPYLDLKLWSIAVKKPITKINAIKILFAGDDNRKLDKTITLVIKFFSNDLNIRTDYLKALTAQGIQEESENQAVQELKQQGRSNKSIAKKLKITEAEVNLHEKYHF